MHKKVAVEKNLTSIKQYFESNGYQVDTIDDTQIDTIGEIGRYDAIIVSGGNNDFLGIQNTNTPTPIIDASGSTPVEIFNKIDQKQ